MRASRRVGQSCRQRTSRGTTYIRSISTSPYNYPKRIMPHLPPTITNSDGEAIVYYLDGMQSWTTKQEPAEVRIFIEAYSAVS